MEQVEVVEWLALVDCWLREKTLTSKMAARPLRSHSSEIAMKLVQGTVLLGPPVLVVAVVVVERQGQARDKSD